MGDDQPPQQTSQAPTGEAGFRQRAIFYSVIVASASVLALLASAAIGLAGLGAVLVGLTVGTIAGVVAVGPLIVAPAQASDAKRRAMIGRIESVARADREELFESLLEVERDAALGPLAIAVHDALVRAHKDRLEAAALRRELSHRVDRETSKRTARLTNEAERDELTGLLNRRGFERRLDETIAECRETHTELALLAIDMDRFKNLNDTCGHEMGDEALRIAGDLLAAHTRDGDIAARVGGDELFLVLRAADAATARSVSERLIGLFTDHPTGKQVGVPWPGMSIGVSRLLADGAADAQELRRLADEALYTSKDQGRGRVTITRAA